MSTDQKNKKQIVHKLKIQTNPDRRVYKEILDDMITRIDRKNSVSLIIQVGGSPVSETGNVKMLAELLSFSASRKIKVQLFNDFDRN